MTDTILFVKEAKTCHYVMVIHTPRLCGEPGFKTRLEQRDEAYIRCREVLHSVEHADPSLPEAAQPFKRRLRNPILSVPPPPPAVEEKEGAKLAGADPTEMIRRALEALMGGAQNSGDGSRIVVEQGDEDGEMWIQLVDADTNAADAGPGGQQPQGDESFLTNLGGRLEEALRAAGYDVNAKKEEEDDERAADQTPRDEL